MSAQKMQDLSSFTRLSSCTPGLYRWKPGVLTTGPPILRLGKHLPVRKVERLLALEKLAGTKVIFETQSWVPRAYTLSTEFDSPEKYPLGI